MRLRAGSEPWRRGQSGVRAMLLGFMDRPDGDQGRCLTDRDGPQQQRVRGAEDGDVGARAEGDRQHGDASKARTPREEPERVWRTSPPMSRSRMSGL